MKKITLVSTPVGQDQESVGTTGTESPELSSLSVIKKTLPGPYKNACKLWAWNMLVEGIFIAYLFCK